MHECLTSGAYAPPDFLRGVDGCLDLYVLVSFQIKEGLERHDKTHISAVEVRLVETRRQIWVRIRQPEDVPQDWTERADLVYVKAWIELLYGVEDAVEDVATLLDPPAPVRAWLRAERAFWRERQAVGEVVVVAAGAAHVGHRGHEAVVEGEDVMIELHEGFCGGLFHDACVAVSATFVPGGLSKRGWM